MNDVKLLPLPEPDWHDDNIRPASFDSYRERTLEEYARACIEADRNARKDEDMRSAIRRVVAHLDDGSLDTSRLPPDMGDDLRHLRALLDAQPPQDTFTERHAELLKSVRVGETLTKEQWESVCAYVIEGDEVIDKQNEWLADLASAPAGVEWTVIVEGLRLADQFFDGDTSYWQWDDGEFFPADKVRTAYQAALAGGGA